MRLSRYFLPTLKESPKEAEIVSHKLMLRAGMISKLAAGIYNYLPLGLRSIRKIEAIIREEMNRAGAVELLMPVIQPAELWQESGRWYKMGPELLRLKDRHERDFIVQPTSEEVVAAIVRETVRSTAAALSRKSRISVSSARRRRSCSDSATLFLSAWIRSVMSSCVPIQY